MVFFVWKLSQLFEWVGSIIRNNICGLKPTQGYKWLQFSFFLWTKIQIINNCFKRWFWIWFISRNWRMFLWLEFCSFVKKLATCNNQNILKSIQDSWLQKHLMWMIFIYWRDCFVFKNCISLGTGFKWRTLPDHLAWDQFLLSKIFLCFAIFCAYSFFEIGPRLCPQVYAD